MLTIGIATDTVDTVGAVLPTKNRQLPFAIGVVMTIMSAATAFLGVATLLGRGQDD